MMQQHDIAIVGAGMIGLTVASLLARSEHAGALRITLLDAGREPAFPVNDEVSLRVSAISAGTTRILEEIGVWQRIVAARACPFREMKVWDAAGSVDGPETLRFDAADFAVPELGFIVENVLIQQALLEQLRSSNVAIRFESPITHIEKSHDRYVISLASGKTLATDLLVGADGARSFVREQANIPLRTWPYAQKAFVTHLRPAIRHCNTAWQRFLETGPLGLLPLADGRVSIVWSTTPELADKALSASDDDLQAMLSAASDEVLGQLVPAGPRGAFPLRAQHAEQYSRPGLVLVGDAAHAIHPLAGQGANLGFSDAAQLAREINAALGVNENPGDLPVLRRYERARKGDNLTMLRFVDGLNRLFSNHSAPAARFRGGGMRLFNNSGPLRERAVQVALGLR
jgi:2-octaprenylphenol hydroxylase